MTGGAPEPVPPIDAAALVRGVNRTTGAGLRLVGTAGSGEVGAGFVRFPNGADGVLTRTAAHPEELERARATLARAGAAGIPTPEYRLIADLGDQRAIVQQRLPGSPPSVWSESLLADLLRLVDRCAGLGQPEETVDLHLTSSGPGFCVHQTLQSYDDRTRRLLADIVAVGAADGGPDSGDDLVHLDFHLGNVLTEHGSITGLVDWDGFGRGDRRIMLVTLLFDLCHRQRFVPGFAGITAHTLADPVDRLRLAPLSAVRRWWAHMALRLVDWTIRHRHPVAVVEHYLDFSVRGLDRLRSGQPLTAASLLPISPATVQDSKR